jgi:UDP-glucose 4-epimerase
MKTVLLTGGAGFIGSNFTAHLLRDGYRVICIDNLALGSKVNIEKYFDNNNFLFYEGDASSTDTLLKISNKENVELVFHLAANSDIKISEKYPETDYKNTFQTTYSILEYMRQKNIKKLFFSSTSAVYGDREDVILSEDIGSLAPISYYGGAKLASEAFISAYSYMNDFSVTIFRFPNVIGPNLTHGVIYDFIKKLKKNDKVLEILGDGEQKKPYIYIDDLIAAMKFIVFDYEPGVNIYNIGVEGTTSVTKIADLICEAMDLKNVQYVYTGGKSGWKGDIPIFQYDLSKIRKRGWSAQYNSTQAVKITIKKVLNS